MRPFAPATVRAPAKDDVALVAVAEINGAVRYDHAAIPRARISPPNVVVPVPV